jgi:hypothetical protein
MFRSTSLIRKLPTPWDLQKALGMGLPHGRCCNVHIKSSQCADVKHLTSTSVCPVCDLDWCDLNFESAL